MFVVTDAATYIHREVRNNFATDHAVGNFLVSFLATHLGGRLSFFGCHHCIGSVLESTV